MQTINLITTITIIKKNYIEYKNNIKTMKK